MSDALSRRAALKTLLTASGALGAVAVLPAGRAAAAAALPHVALKDPAAVALSYVEDASTVDAKKFPTYKPDQHCANCLQSNAPAGDAWRPCNIFPGKLVSAKGWCKVYVKRP